MGLLAQIIYFIAQVLFALIILVIFIGYGWMLFQGIKYLFIFLIYLIYKVVVTKIIIIII